MSECGEILGGGYYTGMVWCVLPAGHKGDHDGGERERQLAEGLAALRLEEQMEWEDLHCQS